MTSYCACDIVLGTREIVNKQTKFRDLLEIVFQCKKSIMPWLFSKVCSKIESDMPQGEVKRDRDMNCQGTKPPILSL